MTADEGTMKYWEEILYTSDPFLVEALHQKSRSEVLEMYRKTNEHLGNLPKESFSTIKQLTKNLQTLEAFINYYFSDADGVGGGTTIS